jgi:HEAT repeat protein
LKFVNARVRTAVAAAATGDPDRLAGLADADPDPLVRATALAALVRTGPRRTAAPAWKRAAADADGRVRRRAAEVAPALGRSAPCGILTGLLADDEAWVAEAAAFALGEHPRISAAAIRALEAAATTHRDPLVREAAVAALGSQGDPATLPTVLAACDDTAAIRRRAVLALAAFDGVAVEARLRRALDDRDWQVRQAAEDLLGVTP